MQNRHTGFLMAASALAILAGCGEADDSGATQPETAAVDGPATRLELVRQTQHFLARLGYRPGAADGIEDQHPGEDLAGVFSSSKKGIEDN